MTGLLLTKDFRSYVRAGRLTDPMLDDRDVILFPDKIGGKYVMMHRPLEWVGEKYGTEFPAIWISMADDLLGFRQSTLLATARFDWECGKIRINTPPIKTRHGWLTIYHAVGSDKHYRLGALLLDLKDPTKVLHRTSDWIMQPERDYEIEGYYRGCVFPCGKVVIDGTLFVYYGAADKYVAVVTCALDEPLRLLLVMTRSYDYGKYHASLDGVKLGGVMDLYSEDASSHEYHLLDFWPDPGTYKLRLECVGKNPTSGGYYLGIESVRLRQRHPRVTQYHHDAEKDWRKNPFSTDNLQDCHLYFDNFLDKFE